MSQTPNYRIYKHCLIWKGESFEEVKLSNLLIFNLLQTGGVDVAKLLRLGL